MNKKYTEIHFILRTEMFDYKEYIYGFDEKCENYSQKIDGIFLRRLFSTAQTKLMMNQISERNAMSCDFI